MHFWMDFIDWSKQNNIYGSELDHNVPQEFQIHDLDKQLVEYAGIFSKIRHILPLQCRIILSNAFIFSRLNYGIELYADLNSNSSTYGHP